jgi:ribosome-associated protein
MSENFLVIELNQQPVELCKLLKIADLVSGGGAAKVVISEGYVLLNGEVEYQKRKKVYHQDVIEFNGEVVQLIINERLSEQVISPANKTTTDISPPVSQNKDNIDNNSRDNLPKNKGAQRNIDIKSNKSNKSNKGKPSAESLTQNNSRTPKKRRPISF